MVQVRLDLLYPLPARLQATDKMVPRDDMKREIITNANNYSQQPALWILVFQKDRLEPDLNCFTRSY
jgi:hypothetical protein